MIGSDYGHADNASELLALAKLPLLIGADVLGAAMAALIVGLVLSICTVTTLLGSLLFPAASVAGRLGPEVPGTVYQAWLSQLGTHYMDYILWANGGSRARWVVGHVHGRGRFHVLLPVLARDEAAFAPVKFLQNATGAVPSASAAHWAISVSWTPQAPPTQPSE